MIFSNNIYIRRKRRYIIYMKKKKQKHNYTSELELKSLLIRIKNKRADIGTPDQNKRINKYVIWHTAINNKKYDAPAKRNKLKAKLKERIIELSERTSVDSPSYERFGQIILLMVKNILKKPQFSGYTYRDDFYSDAVYKILKYLHNFDHTLVSERTGNAVNAFAYISQIIHNSILFIINKKKKENDQLKKQINIENLGHNLQIKDGEYNNRSMWTEDDEEKQIVDTVHLTEIKESLVKEIENLQDRLEGLTRLNVYYPKDYKISFDEYNELQHLLKSKISIMRAKDE